MADSDFFDREAEVDEVWDRLDRGNVLLLAPRRVGKSSLMRRLKDRPRAEYRVISIDVQGAQDPAMMFAEILVDTQRDSALRKGTAKALAFAKKTLSGIDELGISVIKVKLAQEHGPSWRTLGEQVLAALAAVTDRKTLLIVDEFPLMIAHMINTEEQRETAIELLKWFRAQRTKPELSQLRFLIGGSIGLEGLLFRHGLIGTINDLDSFELGPFDRNTAETFLELLAVDESLRMSRDVIAAILDRLACLVPFHLQLVFSRIAQECRRRHCAPSVELFDEVYRERLLGPEVLKDLGHYATRLDDALPALEAKLARRLLDEACRSADGITRSRALATCDDARQDQETLHRVLKVLEHDGYLRYDERAESFVFWSGFLRDWWRRQYCW